MLLTKLSRFRRLPLNWSGFCSEKKKQKALWASLFMQKILSETAPDRMQQPSLSERMLASNLDLAKIQAVDQKFEIDREIAAKMKGIFAEGAQLSELIFQQDRIRGASVVSYQVEFNRGQFRQYTRMSSNNINFIFLPNFLVTQQIFKYLTRSILFSKYNFFSGHHGTSKTAAFILYHHLAGIINEYVYGSQQEEQSQITAFDKAKLLIKPPIVLYLSLKSQDFDYKSVAQSLRSQIPFWKLQSFETFVENEEKRRFSKQNWNYLQYRDKYSRQKYYKTMKMWYFYEIISTIESMSSTKRAPMLTIIDQINRLVGECQDFNSRKVKDETQREKIQIKLDRKLSAVRDIVLGLSPIVFNSAECLNQDLIGRKYWRKSLDFDMDHDGLKSKDLQYTLNLSKKWGSVSFKHYVRDQLEMKLRILLADEKLFKTLQPCLRQVLNTFLEPKEVPHYLGFLYFRFSNISTFGDFFESFARSLEGYSEASTQQQNKQLIQMHQSLQNGLSKYWKQACNEAEDTFIRSVKFNIIKSDDIKETSTKFRMILEMLQVAVKMTQATESERRQREIDAGLEPQQKNNFVVMKKELSKEVQDYMDKARNNVQGSIDKQLLAYREETNYLDKLADNMEFLVFSYSAQYFSVTFSNALRRFGYQYHQINEVIVQALMQRQEQMRSIVRTCLINLLKTGGFRSTIVLKQIVLGEGKYSYEFGSQQQISWKTRFSAEICLPLNEIVAKRQQIKQEKNLLQKAAWKSELRQLEESVQTTLKEIVAKGLLSDPEEFLLTTVIQQGKNHEDHDIEGSAAIDFMMLAASQGEIVVRSYDTAIGDSTIIQNKINESGQFLNLLNDLLLKCIDQMNKAKQTKLTLDYGHCIIGLKEQLPKRPWRRAFYGTPLHMMPESPKCKLFLRDLNPLRYKECPDRYRSLLFENFVKTAIDQTDMIARAKSQTR